MRLASTWKTGEASSTSPWWRSFVTSTWRTEAGLMASGTTPHDTKIAQGRLIKCPHGGLQPARLPQALGTEGGRPGAGSRKQGLRFHVELSRFLCRIRVRGPRHGGGKG